ncbi:SigE family RNA polymerase sigma factor [Nonomuraea sp. NBC_01738]|uniref:SigE family RNA polymerase sigma factor n=1 Tax=Nonomuraea sp. NBC_01738 TaxID=2976003 RepID=UPI002E11D50E|nr:SigE family RNA polymerase sigma factor [Nonomuraea sp. NBC_01738]
MDAFAEYVTTRSVRLRRTAFLLTGDWASADDLVQTALTKAWLAWRRIEGDPDPYVYRILTNTHASWWRRRWRGEVPTGDLPERAVPDFATGAGEKEALWSAIGELSDRQRAVIVLHYFEGLTMPQCAAALGCSLGTVKTQLARALKRLRVHPEIKLAGVGP